MRRINWRAFSNSAAPSCLPSVQSWNALGTDASELAKLVTECSNLLVITGAGVSTESGIPDYRGPGRPAYRPLQHNEFLRQEITRRRYWARSMIGYRALLAKARPNLTHKTLADLEKMGIVNHLITQNVDRLHHKAGHQRVLELHGTIHEVECLSCRHTMGRDKMQLLLQSRNQDWIEKFAQLAEMRPDGDVELAPEAYADFEIPPCPSCGSEMLKPCVVFHGGSVPAPVSEQALALAHACDGMLLLGTTVSTFSAFKLVREAARRHGRVGIVNYGATRADELAAFKIEASVSGVLSALMSHMEARPAAATPPPPAAQPRPSESVVVP